MLYDIYCEHRSQIYCTNRELFSNFNKSKEIKLSCYTILHSDIVKEEQKCIHCRVYNKLKIISKLINKKVY